MKNSAILDIFNGKKGDIETMPLPKEFHQKLAKACDTYDELKEKFSKEHLNLHQKHIDQLEEYWVDEINFFFVQGFKLGLQIGIECMEK